MVDGISAVMLDHGGKMDCQWLYFWYFGIGDSFPFFSEVVDFGDNGVGFVGGLEHVSSRVIRLYLSVLLILFFVDGLHSDLQRSSPPKKKEVHSESYLFY